MKLNISFVYFFKNLIITDKKINKFYNKSYYNIKYNLDDIINGIFYIVPGTHSISRLTKIISEYYRRKRVGKMFCGGIVNYAFIDNWLSGSLYFTQFKVKRLITAINRNSEITAKYCRNIARLVIGQKRLYYLFLP